MQLIYTAKEETDTNMPKNVDTSLTLNAEESAALVGISRSTFWKLYSQGRTPLPLRLGGRVVRWRREELTAWVAAGCPAREKWRYSR